MAALSVVPRQEMSLYAIEDHLQALAETGAAVAPEQEQEFLAEFRQFVMTAAEKRDAVAHYIATLEEQAIFAAAEIKRLQERKASFERQRDHLEQYVIRLIQGLGTDAKGKHKSLEGRTATLSIRRCPASVEISDAAVVPAQYKTVAVKLRAERWEQVLDAIDIDLRVQVEEEARADSEPSKSALKAALATADVPGARLVEDKYSLVIK